MLKIVWFVMCQCEAWGEGKLGSFHKETYLCGFRTTRDFYPPALIKSDQGFTEMEEGGRVCGLPPPTFWVEGGWLGVPLRPGGSHETLGLMVRRW